MYALAATAAGVGMLALSQAAEAKIVYTKTHVAILPKHSYKLRLNHEQTDFTLANITFCSDYCNYEFWLTCAAGNSAIGQLTSGYVWGLALKQGSRIGTGQGFFPKGAFLVVGTGVIFVGHWVNVTNGYLGLKFRIGGKTHYGWARMTVETGAPPTPNAPRISATLTGYAYETIPNKPIIAGKTKGPDVVTVQPASLGRLAQGSAGLAAWRKAGGNK